MLEGQSKQAVATKELPNDLIKKFTLALADKP
jgi:hypothetical protein